MHLQTLQWCAIHHTLKHCRLQNKFSRKLTFTVLLFVALSCEVFQELSTWLQIELVCLTDYLKSANCEKLTALLFTVTDKQLTRHDTHILCCSIFEWSAA